MSMASAPSASRTATSSAIIWCRRSSAHTIPATARSRTAPPPATRRRARTEAKGRRMADRRPERLEMADRPRLSIAISIEEPSWDKLAPDAARLLRRAARDALAQAKNDGWKGSRIGHEISFVLTDDKRMRALNR